MEFCIYNQRIEIDLKRERLLDLHLDGDITTERFRAKSAELEEARVAAEDQLEAARSRLARLDDLARRDSPTSSTTRRTTPFASRTVGLPSLGPTPM